MEVVKHRDTIANVQLQFIRSRSLIKGVLYWDLEKLVYI